MILGIGHLQLETLQGESATNGESCPMSTLAFAIREFHLAGTTEVVACAHPDGFTNQEVGTYSKMLAETLVPTVQTIKGSMQSQGRVDKALADTQLQIQGDTFKLIVIGFDLSTQILGYRRQRPAITLVDIVQSEVEGYGSRTVTANAGGDETGRRERLLAPVPLRPPEGAALPPGLQGPLDGVRGVP